MSGSDGEMGRIPFKFLHGFDESGEGRFRIRQLRIPTLFPLKGVVPIKITGLQKIEAFL